MLFCNFRMTQNTKNNNSEKTTSLRSHFFKFGQGWVVLSYDNFVSHKFISLRPPSTALHVLPFVASVPQAKPFRLWLARSEPQTVVQAQSPLQNLNQKKRLH